MDIPYRGAALLLVTCVDNDLLLLHTDRLAYEFESPFHCV